MSTLERGGGWCYKRSQRTLRSSVADQDEGRCASSTQANATSLPRAPKKKKVEEEEVEKVLVVVPEESKMAREKELDELFQKLREQPTCPLHQHGLKKSVPERM